LGYSSGFGNFNLERMMATKTCKFCRSEVDAEAYKCSHCGEWLRAKKKSGAILVAAISVVVALSCITGFLYIQQQGRKAIQERREEIKRAEEQNRLEILDEMMSQTK
jgi:RNA polymerase subunit RPABC4/transcription elongation factor Spt4